MKKRSHKTDKTGKIRQARRLEGLNRVARAAGFETWRIFETAVLNDQAKISKK